ncbi:MAG: hypothetical protein CSA22_08655 [Deltaproteobacteria bacterium]|nr:MAG: hypothetical protein CSA22_08655 [Deltaproteobacteria bacterium]
MRHVDHQYPNCFGDLEQVFPLTASGLRESPEACRISCQFKTDCLKKALAGEQEGRQTREELVDRQYEAGMIGFLERWSRKKMLNPSGGKPKWKGTKERR